MRESFEVTKIYGREDFVIVCLSDMLSCIYSVHQMLPYSRRVKVQYR